MSDLQFRSELHRLLWLVDSELAILEDTPLEECRAQLTAAGIDPDQLVARLQARFQKLRTNPADEKGKLPQ